MNRLRITAVSHRLISAVSVPRAPAVLLLVVPAMLLTAPAAFAQQSSLLHRRPSPSPYAASSPHAASSPYASARRPLADGPVPAQAIAPGLHDGPRSGPRNVPSAAPLGDSPYGAIQPSGPTLQDVSMIYQPAPPMRTFAKNDIVTIRVDEIARVLAEGEADRRKQTAFEAILTDWLMLAHGRIRPDPLEDGDPAVAGETSSIYRADASIESRESMTFNIAARVVDIRPNGNLVLEARKSMRANDNLWETSLTGICRVQDIAADNVVLSRDLIDLQISKQDRGHLRDGYRRGWFARWFDRVQPF